MDTHFHWDHTEGNAAYAGIGVKVVASKTTQRLIFENFHIHLPVPKKCDRLVEQ